jgi:hypothetical protein
MMAAAAGQRPDVVPTEIQHQALDGRAKHQVSGGWASEGVVPRRSAGVPDLDHAGSGLAVRARVGQHAFFHAPVAAKPVADPAAIDAQAKEQRPATAVGALVEHERLGHVSSLLSRWRGPAFFHL